MKKSASLGALRGIVRSFSNKSVKTKRHETKRRDMDDDSSRHSASSSDGDDDDDERSRQSRGSKASRGSKGRRMKKGIKKLFRMKKEEILNDPPAQIDLRDSKDNTYGSGKNIRNHSLRKSLILDLTPQSKNGSKRKHKQKQLRSKHSTDNNSDSEHEEYTRNLSGILLSHKKDLLTEVGGHNPMDDGHEASLNLFDEQSLMSGGDSSLDESQLSPRHPQHRQVRQGQHDEEPEDASIMCSPLQPSPRNQRSQSHFVESRRSSMASTTSRIDENMVDSLSSQQPAGSSEQNDLANMIAQLEAETKAIEQKLHQTEKENEFARQQSTDNLQALDNTEEQTEYRHFMKPSAAMTELPRDAPPLTPSSGRSLKRDWSTILDKVDGDINILMESLHLELEGIERSESSSVSSSEGSETSFALEEEEEIIHVTRSEIEPGEEMTGGVVRRDVVRGAEPPEMIASESVSVQDFEDSTSTIKLAKSLLTPQDKREYFVPTAAPKNEHGQIFLNTGYPATATRPHQRRAEPPGERLAAPGALSKTSSKGSFQCLQEAPAKLEVSKPQGELKKTSSMRSFQFLQEEEKNDGNDDHYAVNETIQPRNRSLKKTASLRSLQFLQEAEADSGNSYQGQTAIPNIQASLKQQQVSLKKTPSMRSLQLLQGDEVDNMNVGKGSMLRIRPNTEETTTVDELLSDYESDTNYDDDGEFEASLKVWTRGHSEISSSVSQESRYRNSEDLHMRCDPPTDSKEGYRQGGKRHPSFQGLSSDLPNSNSTTFEEVSEMDAGDWLLEQLNRQQEVQKSANSGRDSDISTSRSRKSRDPSSGHLDANDMKAATSILADSDDDDSKSTWTFHTIKTSRTTASNRTPINPSDFLPTWTLRQNRNQNTVASCERNHSTPYVSNDIPENRDCFRQQEQTAECVSNAEKPALSDQHGTFYPIAPAHIETQTKQRISRQKSDPPETGRPENSQRKGIEDHGPQLLHEESGTATMQVMTEEPTSKLLGTSDHTNIQIQSTKKEETIPEKSSFLKMGPKVLSIHQEIPDYQLQNSIADVPTATTPYIAPEVMMAPAITSQIPSQDHRLQQYPSRQQHQQHSSQPNDYPRVPYHSQVPAATTTSAVSAKIQAQALVFHDSNGEHHYFQPSEHTFPPKHDSSQTKTNLRIPVDTQENLKSSPKPDSENGALTAVISFNKLQIQHDEISEITRPELHGRTTNLRFLPNEDTSTAAVFQAIIGRKSGENEPDKKAKKNKKLKKASKKDKEKKTKSTSESDGPYDSLPKKSKKSSSTKSGGDEGIKRTKSTSRKSENRLSLEEKISRMENAILKVLAETDQSRRPDTVDEHDEDWKAWSKERSNKSSENERLRALSQRWGQKTKKESSEEPDGRKSLSRSRHSQKGDKDEEKVSKRKKQKKPGSISRLDERAEHYSSTESLLLKLDAEKSRKKAKAKKLRESSPSRISKPLKTKSTKKKSKKGSDGETETTREASFSSLSINETTDHQKKKPAATHKYLEKSRRKDYTRMVVH